jgi:mannose-6-phosphate isomerase
VIARPCLLDNPVRAYAWGSHTYLPALLGQPVPSDRPWAEVWMGAHPDGPSRLPDGRSLADVVPDLPYLVKLLAAEQPLSIQVHPDLAAARAGFDREQAAGVPRDAPERSYRDRNHKPELLVALTRTDALCGFRSPAETLELAAALAVPALDDALAPLSRAQGSDAWRVAFTGLARRDPAELGRLVAEVAAACRWVGETERGGDERSAGVFAWVRRLAAAFPSDVGALAPLFLHLMVLAPGDAVFVAPGVMHAYLRGAGVEFQASSDNVLRGGLTAKHVDLPELVRVADFAPSQDVRVLPSSEADGVEIYPVPVADFAVWRVRTGGSAGREVPATGPAIVVCVDGWVTVDGAQLDPGRAVFVADAGGRLGMAGLGTAFVAAAG